MGQDLQAQKCSEQKSYTSEVLLRVQVTTTTFRLCYISDIYPFPTFLGGKYLTCLYKHVLSQNVMLNQCIQICFNSLCVFSQAVALTLSNFSYTQMVRLQMFHHINLPLQSDLLDQIWLCTSKKLFVPFIQPEKTNGHFRDAFNPSLLHREIKSDESHP